jgi:cellulose biosynthesis protein BcsQ
MSVFVLGSVRGGPGVTTAACLIAGCLADGVVAEADLDGGVAAVRYGLSQEPGLTTLAASRATDPAAWRQHAQQAGELPVLVGPDTPALAAPLWSRAGTYLAEAFDTADADVVVDAGRLRDDPALHPLLTVAALTAVVVRPEAEHLVALARRLPELRQRTASLAVIFAGTGTYSPKEVTNQLGVEVLGVLPPDLGRGAHDELARAARTLTDTLIARAGQPGPVRASSARLAATDEVPA